MPARAATKLLAIAAVVLAGAVGGCGDDKASPTCVTTQVEPQERPATAVERKAIVEIVREYLAGIRERDAKRYCSAFSESQRNFIAQSHGGDDCASGQRKAWRDAEGQFGAARIRRIYRTYARSAIVDVRVKGDSANAGLDVPPAAGPLSGADSVSLTREGGRWRIDDQIRSG